MFDFSKPVAGSHAVACLISTSAFVLAETRFDEAGKLIPRTRSFETREAVLRKVQVGGGKSSEAIQHIVDLLLAYPELHICFAAPTIALAKQSIARLETATRRKWLLYRGIDGEEEGKPLCAFDDAARAALRAGVDLYTTLCTDCPLKENCTLWAQYESLGNLVVTTHAMLRHGLKPHDKRPVFDLVVIDEDPTSTLLATETHTLSYVNLVRYSGEYEQTLGAIVQGITTAAQKERRVRIQDLPSPHSILRLIAALKPPKVDISRTGPIDEDRVALAEARNKVSRMLSDLLDAMAMSPGFDGALAGCALQLNKETGAINIDITTARDIHSQFSKCETVVVLSATARQELLLRPIPYLLLDELPWQPYEHGKFVYVDGAKSSRSALLNGTKLASGGLEALKMIETLARRHRRVLAVAQKKVIRALKASDLPDNVKTAHFNALEGLNDFERYDAIIILGRPLPTMESCLPLAEAAADFCLATSLGSSQQRNARFAPRRERVHTAKDGKTYTTRDYLHPEPHADAALRAITYAAVAQADRSRGQRRMPDNPVAIYDMTGLDNVWQIDEVIRWRSLCGWFGALEAMGFIPHPAASRGLNELLAAILPSWFPNATAAKNTRAYAKREHGETLDSLVAGSPMRGGVEVYLTMPGGCRVPFIVDAKNATEAAELILEYLPVGTVVESKARRTLPRGAIRLAT